MEGRQLAVGPKLVMCQQEILCVCTNEKHATTLTMQNKNIPLLAV